MLPVFVPLNGNVLTGLEELKEEIEELQHERNQPAPSSTNAAVDLPPPPPDASSPCNIINHPPPDVQGEQPQKKRRHVDCLPPVIDIDGDMQIEERNEFKEERDVQWELAHWFSHAVPFLPWYAPQSQVDIQWKALDQEFPRLALLARRAIP